MRKILSLLIAVVLGVSTAFATTVYCKMTHSWWTQNNAAIAVHYWGGAAETTWPGVRMEAVTGEEGTWSCDVPADVAGLIFVRVNGTGKITDWGAKTVDLTLPTDGKNLFTINETESWGEPGCNGVWSKYVASEPVTPTLENGFYLIGKINGVEGWSAADLSADRKFAANPENPAEFVVSATLAVGDEIKVVNVVNDAITAWYPADGNYVVDAAHAGEKDIYFQETYKAEWVAFGGYFWMGANEEPQVEKYCEKPAGHQKDPNYADANGRVLLTIQKIADSNNIRVAIKNNAAAGNTKPGLNFLWVNAEGATGGVVRYGDGTHAEADVEEVSVIVPFAEARESYNFINIHWAYSGWAGEWAIDGLTVTAAELCEGAAPEPPVEPTLANGFYLIGQNGWDVAALSADLLFAANPEAVGEYVLNTTLAEGQKIKVVKVENNAIVAWYPDGMGTEYTVDAAHAGEKDIYFQETYKAEWVAFGGYFWMGANEEPQVEKYCEKPAGHQKDPNYADANGRVLLTIQKIADSNNIRVAIKNNAAAGNTKPGLNFLWVNAEGATGGVVRYGDGTHAEADVEEVSVIVPFAEARESYNFINIHWAYSGWAGEWAIDGLTVTAAELCEGAAPEPPVEPTLANGFYLIGQNGWDVAALSADLLFAANPEAVGEYVLNTTLAEGQKIKVVKVENNAIVAWYPDGMGTEYTVDAAHAGEKDIYFQETYKTDWATFGGYFWMGSNDPTAISNTAADAKAVKVLRNGQILIKKGDKTYNVIGAIVR